MAQAEKTAASQIRTATESSSVISGGDLIDEEAHNSDHGDGKGQKKSSNDQVCRSPLLGFWPRDAKCIYK